MITKGKIIKKNMLKYYIGKKVFVEWKFEAFMKQKTDLCDVINNTSLQSEDGQNYSIDYNFINAIYEVEESNGLRVVKPNIKLYKYVVMFSYELECDQGLRQKNNDMKLFLFKEIENQNDLNEFKKLFCRDFLNEKDNVYKDSINITNINLLYYGA